MESSKKKKEELQADINRYRDKVNDIRHPLDNVEKSQKEFDERQKELT
jgi:prefoldin subunit 5